MKLINTQVCLAAAIAVSLLAGCSHNDNNAASNSTPVKPTNSTTSGAAYNPHAVQNSQIPSQFPQQGQAGTGQSGAPEPKQ